MDEDNDETRRSVMKKAGGAFLAIPVADSAAASGGSPDSNRNDGEKDDESREILYAGDGVRVVKYSDHEYAVKGDFTPEERQKLMKEYVWSDDVSTQTHSDSGTDSTTECPQVNGDYWGLKAYTDAWSQADNGTLTFEGEASATSWDGCFYNYKRAVDEIYIRTTVGGTYRSNVSNITVPPGYSVSYENAEATLDGSRTDEYSYSLFHYKDAVVMEADDCWYDAYQDDAMQFSIDNEDHVIGTYVGMDVGHCW